MIYKYISSLKNIIDGFKFFSSAVFLVFYKIYTCLNINF